MPILALTRPTYQPAMRVVTAITNSNPAAVTTSFDHNYIDGTIVRLHIPDGFGMMQVDHLYGIITVTSPTTFTIDINTIEFDQFSAPVTFPQSYQSATVVPIGEINSQLTAAVRNVLPYTV